VWARSQQLDHRRGAAHHQECTSQPRTLGPRETGKAESHESNTDCKSTPAISEDDHGGAEPGAGG
jgi:hypothetical protein